MRTSRTPTLRTAFALVLLWFPTSAMAQAFGNPIVYHSPNGDGTPPSESFQITLPLTELTLDLYIDYENSPDVGASTGGGTMCVDANGDETCAFDVEFQLQSDAATLETFTPASSSIVGHIDAAANTFRVNGVDVNGMPIPAPIGVLTIDAEDANILQVTAVGMHRVGAAGQLDAIQSQVVVPEPSRFLAQLGGVAMLAGLYRLRTRRNSWLPTA